MMHRDRTLEDILAEVAVQDGRVGISANGDAKVSVHTVEEVDDESVEQLVLSIRVSGDGFRASIDLTASERAELLEVLQDDVVDLEDEYGTATNGGRDEPTRHEPADFGGGESTGVQDL